MTRTTYGQKIRVVTDSVADLPWDLAHRLGIQVVPIYVILGGKSYLADAALDSAWFYREWERYDQRSQTAAPPPEEFLAAYGELVAEGATDIIGLFLASPLSSIVRHARQAAKFLNEDEARVHIVETGQVSMGVGWMAIAAAEAIAQGATLPEVLALLEGMRARTYVRGVLASLDHLRRGGRVGWAAVQMAGWLRIKPIISYAQSEAKLAGHVRTYHRALERLTNFVTTIAPIERLAIIHSRAPQEALDQLQGDLAALIDAPLLTVEVGPIFGTHVGPKGIGVAVVRAEPVEKVKA
ncbi:MAG: DegV family protein [Anaerolineales bacterium]